MEKRLARVGTARSSLRTRGSRCGGDGGGAGLQEVEREDEEVEEEQQLSSVEPWVNVRVMEARSKRGASACCCC